MIQLRKMRASEFAGFVAYFVPDYAAEISTNYDVDLATAQVRATQDVVGDLGQGVETPGQVLLCIVREGDQTDTPVGYLWCKPDSAGPTVFISDFYIYPEHRGQGFAKAALRALEVMFAATGHSEGRLRVAADNTNAQRLYQAAGYRVTGTNMRKAFDGSETA